MQGGVDVIDSEVVVVRRDAGRWGLKMEIDRVASFDWDLEGYEGAPFR